MESNYLRINGDSVLNDVVYFIHRNYKLIIIAISIVAVLSIFFLGDRFSEEVSASTSNQKYFVCVNINDGDTLWSIADTYISEEYYSVDEYVDEIKQLNHLTDDKIYSGATLVVPYYAP